MDLIRRRFWCGLAMAVAVAVAAMGSLATSAASRKMPVTPDWRTLVTDADRQRLRGWRTAFTGALAQARTAGAGPRIDGGGVLLLPDAGIDRPVPPPGDYRCRVTKLGTRRAGGAVYAVGDWFACQIVPQQGAAAAFAELGGMQRPVGLLYADSTRAVFLGTLALGDERRAMDYRRDADRDVAGLLERIGPARWRLLLPYPHWESIMDVMEIVPVDTSL